MKPVARDTLVDFFHDLYSCAQVGRAACAFAVRLADAGVRKGDKVVFWSENRPGWIVAFWGCLLNGVVNCMSW